MPSTATSSSRLVPALAALALGGALALSGCSNAGESTAAPSQSPGTIAASQSGVPTDDAASSDAESPAPEDGSTPTPSGDLEVGSSAEAGATASVAAPTGALKKASTATLPDKLAGMAGQVSEQDPNTVVGMYTGTTEDQMLVATLSKSQQKSAALGLLSKPVTEGHTTCGTIASTGLAGCYLWLDGGNIQVYGTDRSKVTDLRAAAEELWNALP